MRNPTIFERRKRRIAPLAALIAGLSTNAEATAHQPEPPAIELAHTTVESFNQARFQFEWTLEQVKNYQVTGQTNAEELQRLRLQATESYVATIKCLAQLTGDEHTEQAIRVEADLSKIYVDFVAYDRIGKVQSEFAVLNGEHGILDGTVGALFYYNPSLLTEYEQSLQVTEPNLIILSSLELAFVNMQSGALTSYLRAHEANVQIDLLERVNQEISRLYQQYNVYRQMRDYPYSEYDPPSHY